MQVGVADLVPVSRNGPYGRFFETSPPEAHPVCFRPQRAGAERGTTMRASVLNAASHQSPELESTALAKLYRSVRRTSEYLAEPLTPEDQNLQSMPDASPVKWHLAHTTWFFETFLLVPMLRGYSPFRKEFRCIFNSYYNA